MDSRAQQQRLDIEGRSTCNERNSETLLRIKKSILGKDTREPGDDTHRSSGREHKYTKHKVYAQNDIHKNIIEDNRYQIY